MEVYIGHRVVKAPYNKHRTVYHDPNAGACCDTCSKGTQYPCHICGQCAEEASRIPNERN